MDAKTITRTRRVLTGGRWFLIIGLVFYSAMTTTPFVAGHSAWSWSGWVLGLIVDVAFIMALSAESTLAKYGVTGLGAWPVAFRWITGLASVFLNTWLSVAARDWVGVAVHVIAPALVMLLAEVGPRYMAALAEVEREAPFALTAEERAQHPAFNVQAFEELLDAQPDPIDVAQDFAAEEAPQGLIRHERMPNAEANKIIEEGWRHKLDPVEVAAAAGRHPATVRKRFKQLDAELTV
ncbi:hypothetical protein [Streptomyces sp. NPDC008125]|uniref:hypothetical protein n=1 Tax=Streptomyces sp. NPDC008125 TaxID=3364811 RepID=UPI0036E87E90